MQDADDSDSQNRRIDIISDPSLGNASPDNLDCGRLDIALPSDEVPMTRMIGVERLGCYNRSEASEVGQFIVFFKQSPPLPEPPKPIGTGHLVAFEPGSTIINLCHYLS
jgi:hypothetical protein